MKKTLGLAIIFKRKKNNREQTKYILKKETPLKSFLTKIFLFSGDDQNERNVCVYLRQILSLTKINETKECRIN